MRKITREEIIEWSLDDPVKKRMTRFETHTERWMEASTAKRFIYWKLYGDLFDREGLQITDVGGGDFCLNTVLATNHSYRLIDIIDGPYWQDAEFFDSDIYISNDLFPNVDQCLKMFLKKALPKCNELRISLTCHKPGRYYITKRVFGDEILTVLAWTETQVMDVLDKYWGQITSIERVGNDVFENGRVVLIVRMRGTLDEYRSLRQGSGS